MLKIDISAGNHISSACTTAARLARHPLATIAVPGAWYAFTMGDEWLVLALGPWYKPDGAVEDYDGQLFWDACRDLRLRNYVRALSDDKGPGVAFDFNGETVTCDAMRHDDPRTVADVAAALHAQWDAKMKAASDAYWTPERIAKREQGERAHAEKMAKRREMVSEALSKHPFQPTDPDGYAEYTRINADSYGGAVVRYGEGWAAMMEALLLTGNSVADAAEIAQDEADAEGITGFMFGCAVQQLVKFWVHGEALRQWHNAKYDRSGKANATPGAVVNPAILTLS